MGKAERILGTLLGSAEVNKTETHTEGKVRETLEGHVERKAERILEVSAGGKGAGLKLWRRWTPAMGETGRKPFSGG